MNVKLLIDTTPCDDPDRPCKSAIISIDGVRHYIVEGWCFAGLSGYANRWAGGVAVRLQDADTPESLSKTWNGKVSIIDAAIHGYDDTRPIVFGGKKLENVAKLAGL